MSIKDDICKHSQCHGKRRLQMKNFNNSYCDKHRNLYCWKRDCNVRIDRDIDGDDIRYCSDHRCITNGCMRVRQNNIKQFILY